MREQIKLPEEILLEALKGFYKGVNKKPLEHLAEHRVPYYSQLLSSLYKNNMVRYNKDLANPHTQWVGSNPPDINTARSLLDDAIQSMKRKNSSRKEKNIAKIKILCERLSETSPGFGVDLSRIGYLDERTLLKMYGDLERTVMRSEVEGPVYDRHVAGVDGLRLLVENASDPAVRIPWNGDDRARKKFKGPNINLDRKSLTVELMSIVRSVQILASVDSTVEAAELQAIIHRKMRENPGLRQVYMAYLKKEI